jgi:c(7)-type cytochrome triheme protein
VRSVKDVDEPEISLGLEGVPYYSRRSYGFNTQVAFKRQRQQKLAEQKRLKRRKDEEDRAVEEIFNEEVKKRVIGTDIRIAIPDPWIPPEKRNVMDMPLSLRVFPKDKYGYPHWTRAVEEGLLNPLSSLKRNPPKEEMLETDILFQINDRLMANVLFPHKVHTYWLSCKICHPGIFKAKKGANDFTMYDIWNGKFCGRCHGKVAFQPKGFRNCRRCHSVGKKTMGIQ